jgi:hypothetical protein
VLVWPRTSIREGRRLSADAGEELARLKAAALNLIGLLSDDLVRSEQLVAGSVEPW